MDTRLVSTVLAANMAATQNSAQVAILKKSHEMEMELVNMLTQSTAAQAPAPAGQGLKVDRTA
ncbi:hypothetical protein GCM10007989_22260 [Devosia pacifica]|uniref:Motility protein n=1 Tax=Devosia pacifica TaxID=1335967 RepID=A0A918S6J8_9HYPH|nr:hypothetical protein [Devosia pacifica]GHA26086.1 hypothetical protein GCM10007989_22260 [Devosia pacifica]